MRRFLWAFLLLGCLVGAVRAEDDFAPDAAQTADSSQIQKFSPEELNTLLSPIALYPDALLAQIFPACTFPDQITVANQYVQTSPTPTVPPDSTSWDSSIVALLNYPSVLRQLNANLTWAEQLGVAGTYQMDDVSAMIQQIRSEAQAVGNLESNDKQNVVMDGDAIQIEPASSDVLYVPTYDPVYICDHHIPIIWTSYGFGNWLCNRWDWRGHRIYVGGGWRPGQGWYSSSRPIYWRPRPRPIPSWYLRSNGRRPGPPVRPMPRPLAHPGKPAERPFNARPNPIRPVLPIRPKPERETKPVERPVVKPEIRPARPVFKPSVTEGIESNRFQINKEAHRGETSRAPARIETPRAPVQHIERQAAPLRQELSRPSSNRSAVQESSRGAQSRGKR